MYNRQQKIRKFTSDDIFLLKLVGGCTVVVLVCLISFL